MRKNFKEGIHVTIYNTDFPTTVWAQYCDICGLPYTTKSITLNTYDIVYEDSVEVVHPGQTSLFDTPSVPVAEPSLDIPCDIALLDMEVGE